MPHRPFHSAPEPYTPPVLPPGAVTGIDPYDAAALKDHEFKVWLESIRAAGPNQFSLSDFAQDPNQQPLMVDPLPGADVSGYAWPPPPQGTPLTPDQARRLDEAGLLRAVRRAVGGAALAHLAAVAHGRGLPPDRVAHGEELVAGRRRLTPPPTYRSPRLAPPRGPVHPRAWRADERWGRTATGRSHEGEVVVVLGWVGGLRELHADAGFLRSTSPDLLRYALTEAFTAAQEGPRA